MRFFLKYFIPLVILTGLATWYIPVRYDLPYPQSAGPHFSNQVRSAHAKAIDKDLPKIVLAGDSTLEQGVDEPTLSEVTGEPVYAISVPASSTAVWYLLLKNIIIDGTVNRPKYLIILFRDTLLTLPDFRVNGGHVREVDEFAGAREEFLLQTAYLNFMNPLEIWAERYFPLYSSRQLMKESLDYYTNSALPNATLPCKGSCVDRAMAAVFYNDETIDPDFQSTLLRAEDSALYTREAMDFQRQVSRSFLPEIIRLAKENNIQLIFVQTNTLNFPNPESQPKGLFQYKRDLAAYLEENNVPLLDFSFDPRLSPGYYRDTLHMTEEGQVVFSTILGQALLEIIH